MNTFTEENTMTPALKLLKKIIKSQVSKVYIMMIILYLISGLIEFNYFSIDHIMHTLVAASFLGIVAIGQTIVIITGGIDLSVSYALNLGAVIMTQMTNEYGGIVALITVLAIGLLCGSLNGIGISYLKISPIIMTLAMNSILLSVTLVYTGGTPKGAAPEWLRYISTAYFLRLRVAIIVWIVLAVLTIILLKKSTFGRKIYAIGNSAPVAYLSGINSKVILIVVYSLSSLFAVISGIMMTGFTGLSNLGMGNEYQLSSIASVVLGGTSIIGGNGSYLGTIAGVIIIYILMSILIAFNIREAGRKIIYGFVILMVLFIYGREKSTDK